MKRIAFVGNYLPSLCGIATFTTDLTEALATQFPETTFLVLPTSDPDVQSGYPERVRFIIERGEIDYYNQAAYFLNMNHVDLVCLQHEYGIFGGPSGSHILSLLRNLQMPVVTTFHTILRKPKKQQASILKDIIDLSDRVVVMTRRDMEFLKKRYSVPRQKIDLIHHGIPDVPFIDPNFYKDQLGVEGKYVLLTFGLLSANKGIEYVIQALPAVLEKHPNVVYILLGATHPNVLRWEGEKYRESLIQLAEDLGVTEQVIFHNRFVNLDKLIEYISAADVYITPYLNPEQSVSGTLSYAVGAGKAVISTPYWHAEELLAESRGLLVPFKDANAISEQILYLLEDEVKRHTLRKRGYLKSREMVWEETARKYMASFTNALEVRRSHPQPIVNSNKVGELVTDLPSRKIDHLQRLTDDTGILQHAIHAVPRFEHGYATDDNARALIAAVLMEDWKEYALQAQELAFSYLAFLWHAFNRKTARFRNMLSYDRRWLDEDGSEDCHGRSIWALGTVVGRSRVRGLREVADQLFQRALPASRRFKSPRACAFTARGINEYLKRFSGDLRAANVREKMVRFLVELFEKGSDSEWQWFEDYLTYSNAKLPHALLVCGPSLSDDDITRIGLESLEWLTKVQTSEEGYFVPIGNNGFYHRGKQRARFDQQPIETYATVSACIEAYHITGDEKWRLEARKAFDWYLGRNDLNLPLYDPLTGGCRDGLHPDRANQNQGAESSVTFLLSLLEVSSMEQMKPLPGVEPVKESAPQGSAAKAT
ncbi:MAG: glycosyltransferase family 4 protein [Fidelibacterota bacterium]|nr:MAG: glycosyltransferase family 4 protein [Candidatus Neomarinimicrobiota bacterium]